MSRGEVAGKMRFKGSSGICQTNKGSLAWFGWKEMACPKVCRYAGQFTFEELQIGGHDSVIILENGKRRAGKIHTAKLQRVW